MHLSKILSAAAVGVLALASAAPGLAQGTPTPATTPAVQSTPAGQAAAQGSEPFDVAVARRMTPEELKKHMDAGEKVYVVDARFSPRGAIVKGAVLKTTEQLEAWAKESNVPKNALIVAYCT